MLNIRTSVSLEVLADNMIVEIKNNWKNPFDAPVVVFSDSKLAQWFKFRWLEKNGALANLNLKYIDAFIFESIVDENDDYKQLTQDILRNLIIAYLEKKLEKSNNEKMFDDINNYLYDEDGIVTPLTAYGSQSPQSLRDSSPTIRGGASSARNDDSKEELNHARLFDLAEMLAGIFLEYEYSRPGDVSNNNGIIDYWINDKDYFEPDGETAKIKEEWQKKIYFDIFSENGCLREVNEELNNNDETFGDYVTLPKLFRKKSGGASSVCDNSSNSVFVFGFDSMEPFYRNAIKCLSLKYNINLYLSNPFGKETEENKNELLSYWGGAGERNIEFWGKLADEFMNLDNNRNFSPQNNSLKIPLNLPLKSNLHLLQRAIVENKNKIDYNSSSSQTIVDKNDESLVIISAPSKLREVEILHSNICKLLLNKKAQIKDIVVASPNLDLYRSAVYQVFSQSSQKADYTYSRYRSLYIPFTFIDSSDNESLTYLALKRLFAIKEKGVLNRPDFFDLVRNPVVQAARGILQDEVSNWEGWISALNIYRDRKLDDNSVEKNWIQSVKSLLLAKLSNVAIDFSEETIKPFSDIASSDNESVCRFIDCIDDIEEWLSVEGQFKLARPQSETLQPPQSLSDSSPTIRGGASSLDEAFGKIEKWFMMNKVPSGLGNENFIFQRVIKAKDDLKWQFAAGSKNIPWKIFSKTLLYASSKAKYNTGNLFVNGITFMNFVPNRVIPTKFMFLLGIDEKTFPSKDYKNSLDLRHEKPIDSDEINSEKDKYAFLNQLLNVKEAIYISYVNKDLQKDEDFYPSSVIDDLSRFFRKYGKELNVVKCKNIEDRSWNELFSQSALRNKETYEMMKSKENEYNKGKTLSDTSEGLPRHCNALHCSPLSQLADSSSTIRGGASKGDCPERVTIYQLRSFLEEPFKARINRILYSEDEEDTEKIEFEPIEFNKLDNSRLIKEFVIYCLSNNIECNDESELKNILINNKDNSVSIFDSIFDKLSLQLPNESFGEKVKVDLIHNAFNYINRIKVKYSDYNFYSEVFTNDFECVDNNKSIIWNLSGTAKIVARKDDIIHIIDLLTSKDIYSHSYINAYILTLVYLSKNNKNEKIYIDLYSTSNEKTIPIKYNAEKAIAILNDIYKKTFIEKYHKVLPIDLFKEKIENYDDYLGKFEDDFKNPWKYFSLGKLFDVKEVCGFKDETFIDEWEEEKTNQLKLFPEELRESLLPAKGKKK